MAENLFGMVQVDIRVPNQWPHDKIPPSKLSPWEYFQEMSPLFGNEQIPFEAIGEHMQEHVRTFGLSQKPRHLLVGAMKGKEMLIATPLLRWYLQHGMELTKIHEVIEFVPQACFRDFVKQVSDARRLGDTNQSCAVIADTMKLIGNSAYGSLIMNQEKHQTIKYVDSSKEASRLVNEPQFLKLSELESDFFEVELTKKKIVFHLPIQLGYFILQYAKLRMLEFYYDFMDVYID